MFLASFKWEAGNLGKDQAEEGRTKKEKKCAWGLGC